jgi:hypothetical protein
MIKSRNLTSHTYNLNIAETIVQQIIDNYYISLENFYKKMLDISKK